MNCSPVRGPMIGAVTAGWWSSHASATSAGSSPSSAHSASHASSWSRLRSTSLVHPLGATPALGHLLQRAAEQAAAERAPREDADAVRLAAGSTSSSTVRAFRL